MSLLISEADLPQELTVEQAVDAAYAAELAQVTSDLQRGLPVLLECEKDLSPFVFLNLRTRLKQARLSCQYLDGRPRTTTAETGPAPAGFVGTMLAQLRDAVRGAVEKKIVVLPHLDLLTTSQGGLSPEAREVIPLLFENPELLWLGFKDPSFPLPAAIENLFPRRVSLLGISRTRLRHLVTRKEARKFGRNFSPWALYKYVSGMNAARLRKLLASLEGEDYPLDPRPAYQQIRQATLTGQLEMPEVDLDRDIGGYAPVKQRLKSEILDVLAFKERLTDAAEIARLERLIPRGMIFWGPPGTGKTLFAKAIATAIGAAITIVSGPELKSRWVGESEENLRQIFHRARRSAPALIVFDELDSFASARGTYTGSGVEHSMVNQLLTEMDGFRSEELVFVVGTTNFVESLDPALLRPGRFEFHLHVPYPQADDRREILRIHDARMQLALSAEALEYAVRRTAEPVPGAAQGTHFSGDHLNALCRAVARQRLREQTTRPAVAADIEHALRAWADPLPSSPASRQMQAIHVAGHAVCALCSPAATPLGRISLSGDPASAAGAIDSREPLQQFAVTRRQLLDDLCVLFGGREAEQLLLAECSLAAADDLQRATQLARSLAVQFGGPLLESGDDARRPHELADPHAGASGGRLGLELLREARDRAAAFLHERQALLETIRDLLLERETIEWPELVDLAHRLAPGA